VAAQVARLPGPIRRSAMRLAGARPRVAARFGPAVGVTSLGMWRYPASSCRGRESRLA